MKPSDRSLEIAVVGLGQAGGNLAAEFARRGYRAMALNTAQSDLSALNEAGGIGLDESQRLYIGLDGYDGAGADLNYGIECVTENAERIRDVVSSHAEGADILVVTAGLGGGTGSAVSELVRALEGVDVPMVILATLPGDHESGIAKVNAVRAVSELLKLPDLGIVFADNARLAQLHGSVTLDEYFERINEVIVAPLDAFNQLNGRSGLHPIRTLDGEDLRTLLMSTGILNYAEGELKQLSVEGVNLWIKDALQTSSVMPAGFSLDELAYVGLVLEASSVVLAHTPFTFFNEIGEQLKNSTSGAGIYMGVYRNEAMAGDAPTRIRLLASTPTMPNGIAAIVSDAQREGSALRDKLNRAVSTIDLGDIADFELLPSRSPNPGPPDASRRRSRNSRRPRPVPARQPEAPAPTLSGLTTPSPQVSRPQPSESAVAQSSPVKAKAQPPGPPPIPAASAAAGSGPNNHTAQSSATNGSRQAQPPGPPPGASSPSSPDLKTAGQPGSPSDALAAAPPPRITTHNTLPPESLDPAAETGDKSEPETYDRLVDAFINTESTSIRKRIASRLHTSRNSDHPLARFYANRAIERLVDAGQEEALQHVMSSLGA